MAFVRSLVINLKNLDREGVFQDGYSTITNATTLSGNYWTTDVSIDNRINCFGFC